MDTRADTDPTTPITGRSGSCVNCSRPDEYDNFVQCDKCDAWWHMSCAEVTPTIAERPWTCRKCLPVQVTSHAGSSTGAMSNASARATLKLKLMEEEREIQRREFEYEKEMLRKKYEILEQQLEETERKSGRSRISRKTSMEQVQQWVAKHGVGVDAVGDQQKGPGVIRKPAGTEKEKHHEDVQPAVKPLEKGQLCEPQRKLQQFEIHRVDLPMASGVISGAVPKTYAKETGSIKPPIPPPVSKRNYPALVPPEIPQGKPHVNPHFDAIKARTTPLIGENYYEKMISKFGTTDLVQDPLCSRSFRDEISHVHDTTACLDPGLSHPRNNHENFVPLQNIGGVSQNNMNSHCQLNAFAPRDIQLPPHLVPTPSQLAARQVLPRDLPFFGGDPEDWPIFISSFLNSTVACGFNSAENLARLQRCLKSVAYESVKSRLLLPESVPHVINTLYLLYGRPELLVNTLLEKVRAVQPPKAEKLETLIEFGMVVQSLCDHLEAAGQQAHLSNPSLLMELVGKLPAHTKLEWATFMQQFPEVNLKTFGMFMSGIVVSASKVTLYSGAKVQKKSDTADRPKHRLGASINAHALEPEPESGTERSCYVCRRQDHRVRDCSTFRTLSIDDRWKAIQEHALCRSCLNSHGRRACRNTNPCGVAGCRFRHHPLLHSSRYDRAMESAEIAGNHTHSLSEQQLLFRILPVTIHGPRKAVTVYAFLDDGSSITLVEESLMKDLELTGERVPLCLTWTGNVTRMEADSRKLQLEVSRLNNSKRLSLRDVRTVKKLALPGQSLCPEEYSARYRHLRGLPLVGYDKAVPQLLIGLNNLKLTVPLKVREGDSNDPIAVQTRLGWCIYGGGEISSKHFVQYHACSRDNDDELHNMVKEYFTLEDVGAKIVDNLESPEDKRAKWMLEQTTKRVGNRYETGLLWKRDDVKLPDNYDMALRRLECLERRMQKDLLLKKSIHEQLAEYQAKGYAHRATQKELSCADPDRIWYLPLGAVTNPKKPGKVRLIWDAAAMKNGMSLNTLLLKGPDQLTLLPSVLMRFRQYPVGVSADIKEMLHQILICPRDRHSQRFYGVASQFIKNKNAREFIDLYPRAVHAILTNHYVDDYLDSFQSAEEAIEVSNQVKMIHLKAGFDLRGWQSNVVTVLKSLGENEVEEKEHRFLDKTQQYERVLGMLWRTECDMLCFSTPINAEIQQLINNDNRPTKRQVLKCLMSFFDPLGLLSCLLVHGKIILQEIWRTGIQWDQEITTEAWQRWRKWSEALREVDKIHIPRCYFDGANSQLYDYLQLHIFVDMGKQNAPSSLPKPE
ncbi:uncharacterized protein LOC129773625 [Toxorhynchites rutilus septentrionalis]|uniref:uncharacterized protein LOC129773625 n=1 Tax=Toxorhynchites rutilus septentrionalis TaxID=329112 RepID=UPI00247AB278|nr:uncharacterized protein LOC129773625 [Toxorhynchites rutilus septentrionalis]